MHRCASVVAGQQKEAGSAVPSRLCHGRTAICGSNDNSIVLAKPLLCGVAQGFTPGAL